ncbi:hypothetical protein AS033_10190 [Exiguobacterium indicum]|uniref:Uncharacterized protein n=1 Tax=Exiguobacterium indicum TaxID=296995 RepID=A0A0V8GEH5_9BACL|nr:hypothetical protein AS033_10190 [Exiguobacterium enclense]
MDEVVQVLYDNEMNQWNDSYQNIVPLYRNVPLNLVCEQIGFQMFEWNEVFVLWQSLKKGGWSSDHNAIQKV